jgi:hypothetical protein
LETLGLTMRFKFNKKAVDQFITPRYIRGRYRL